MFVSRTIIWLQCWWRYICLLWRNT